MKSLRVRRPLRNDDGTTLVVAMMVMGIVTTLSVLVISIAIQTGRTTGGDRERLASINAAEAVVDTAYAEIQTSGLSLPCTWPATGSLEMKAFPDTATAVANIRYYGAASTVTPLTCVGGVLSDPEVPVSAVIEGVGGTGTDVNDQRMMQAFVSLSPVTGNGFSKAMFGESVVSLSNNASVTGTGTETADMYSNGNFTCSNSPTFGGSILAPNGTITMDGTCTATGDVWANGNINITGNKTIGGRIISTTGSITLASNTNVNGTLIAAGDISWTGCSAAGKCLEFQSAVPSAPSTPFPILRGDAATLAAWQAQGYVVTAYTGACGAAGRTAGDWIETQAEATNAAITKALYTTTCPVLFRGLNIAFKRDVAVFAQGGITTSNNTSFTSSNTAVTRLVHLVMPYDAATRPCATPVTGPTNNFSSTPSISLLWYSPCNISYGNQGGSYGQVFTGSTLTTNNQYTLTYRQVPVWGIDPASQPTTAYEVDVVYKREGRD